MVTLPAGGRDLALRLGGFLRCVDPMTLRLGEGLALFIAPILIVLVWGELDPWRCTGSARYSIFVRSQVAVGICSLAWIPITIFNATATRPRSSGRSLRITQR